MVEWPDRWTPIRTERYWGQRIFTAVTFSEEEVCRWELGLMKLALVQQYADRLVSGRADLTLVVSELLPTGNWRCKFLVEALK